MSKDTSQQMNPMIPRQHQPHATNQSTSVRKYKSHHDDKKEAVALGSSILKIERWLYQKTFISPLRAGKDQSEICNRLCALRIYSSCHRHKEICLRVPSHDYFGLTLADAVEMAKIRLLQSMLLMMGLNPCLRKVKNNLSSRKVICYWYREPSSSG